ncbi:DEAD/DEAH box helicase [Rhodococcus sp. IEGM 1379]|uniref:DEAD/DEAH box helicase n=1 Tax=Rhodococcus sp. IEGM 1379 TaxID=3047086 RepID=UPI0024B71DBB|nr:DEAD/DEAH box helicase [Rhodococcus sp. IEGM 1379]MDI9916359.1 DEAD/DEAH box helicase [Rhodococcus sp. IEGM 1379]
MQPAAATVLDLDQIRAVVGTTTFQRGLTYFRQGAVREFEWAPASETIVGEVSGTKTYVTTVFLTRRPHGVVTILRGVCTCPVRMNCKHVAALVVAAAAQAELPKPSVNWEDSLRTLLRSGPVEHAATDLGIQFTLRTQGERRQLLVKPVQPGARGWISGGLAWNKLGTSYQHPARQIRILHDIHLLFNGGSVYRHQTATDFDLADFPSPGLWTLLAEARSAGIPLMHSDPRLGPVTLEHSAHLSIDVTTGPDDGLIIAPSVQIATDTEGPNSTPSIWRLIGPSAHGVFTADPDGTIRLAPLSDPIAPELQEFFNARNTIDVPAEHRDTFTSRYAVNLGALADIVSSDNSYVAPAVTGPVLHLQASFSDDHRVDLRWAWHYAVGTERFSVAVEAHSTTVDCRSYNNEQSILDTVLPLLTPTGNPPSSQKLSDGPLTGLDTMRFALDVLPLLLDHPDTEVAVIGSPANYRATDDSLVIGLSTSASSDNVSSDWFDLDVTVNADGQEVHFADIFAALSRGDTELLLADGAYFSLDKPELRELQRLIAEARSLLDRPNGPLKISKFQAGLWDDLTSLGIIEHQAAQWKEQVGGLLAHPTIEQVDVPETLQATLRPYQIDGYRWLNFLRKHGLGGILADDMGLGKTLQTLAMIAVARQTDPTAPPFLIVAPTSVVSNWKSEIARFTPELATVVVAGTLKRQNIDLTNIVDGADIVLTSYTLLRLDAESYSANSWSGLILDEAQFAKNHKSKVHQCARNLETPFKLAITGTPMENNLTELWSLLSITAPGLFPNAAQFTEQYRRPIENDGDTDRLEQLRRRVKPLMIRRTKEQVVHDLPAKQEQVLEIELHPKHRTLYDTHLQRERQKILGLLTDVDKNRFTILASLTLLRQLSLDASLIDDKHTAIPSAKVDALVEQLDDVVAGGHRALIFSQFTGFLTSVRKRLDAENIRYCYLDGSTRNRGEVLDEFKTGTAPVFLISLKAGGFGLNLTEADYCFILDPWWNPATETQAVDRAHRIGQTRNVMVYRLIAKDTIEDKVMALKAKKSALFSSVMDSDELLSSTLEADDIRALFD